MYRQSIKKIVLCAMLAALCCLSTLVVQIPAPLVGYLNLGDCVVLTAAFLLGPWYGVGVAFCASLIRNLLGLGSLMAFPGSMFGALLCGLAFWKSRSIPLTLLAEVFGTALLGGLCAYPIAILFMGVQAGEIAFYAYIIPFLISTVGGAVLSAVLLGALKNTGILETCR